MKVFETALAVTMTTVLVACATEEPQVEQAPEVTLDGADPADEGQSYNGWHQFPWLYTSGTWGTEFRRYSGDATRGGGACLVAGTGASCSSDTSCTTTAQGLFGASAYGYCWTGVCYYRPGSAGEMCIQNPNRTPAVYSGPSAALSLFYSRISPLATYDFGTLGCMTKTAGPNSACGGTDTSLYMRLMQPWYFDQL